MKLFFELLSAQNESRRWSVLEHFLQQYSHLCFSITPVECFFTSQLSWKEEIQQFIGTMIDVWKTINPLLLQGWFEKFLWKPFSVWLINMGFLCGIVVLNNTGYTWIECNLKHCGLQTVLIIFTQSIFRRMTVLLFNFVWMLEFSDEWSEFS